MCQRILLHSVFADSCQWSSIHFAVTSSIQSVRMTVECVCAVLTCMTDFGNKCERREPRARTRGIHLYGGYRNKSHCAAVVSTRLKSHVRPLGPVNVGHSGLAGRITARHSAVRKLLSLVSVSFFSLQTALKSILHLETHIGSMIKHNVHFHYDCHTSRTRNPNALLYNTEFEHNRINEQSNILLIL